MDCTKCKNNCFNAATQTCSDHIGVNEKLIKLYHAVNALMCTLGADGEVNAQQDESCAVMSALADIDRGTYNTDWII